MTSPPQPLPDAYHGWLIDLKSRISHARQRAVLSVNRELIVLYWHIGQDILTRQQDAGWGAKIIDRLSADLRHEFPDMKGFSARNLKYMKKFAQTWPESDFVQQLAAQLPWTHLCVLMDKPGSRTQAEWYAHKAIENGWSRNVLVHQIDSDLYRRGGQTINNFQATLPAAQSELAQQTFKDPYIFDFLNLGETLSEHELENALTQHITRFLLELGSGFSYVGKQVHLEVGGEDFYLDLLFYHLKMRCYVVIELKSGDFRPEHTGQLDFYLTAVDRQMKGEYDTPTIGLLLCKNRNKIIAEYALHSNRQPIGIAEYRLSQLPSIAMIEAALNSHDTSTP